LVCSIGLGVFLVGRIGEKTPILVQCDREEIEKVDRAAKVLEGLQKGIK